MSIFVISLFVPSRSMRFNHSTRGAAWASRLHHRRRLWMSNVRSGKSTAVEDCREWKNIVRFCAFEDDGETGKKRARRALLSAAATRERTRSPDRRLGLQVSCQVSRRIYRTQPTRIGSPVMSRLPQGCATFTRLVFILDLGGRGYEPGGERASSAKAVRDARWKKKSFFGRFFAQARPTKQQPRGLSS